MSIDSRETNRPPSARFHPTATRLIYISFILLFGLVQDAVVVDEAKEHERRHFLEYINAMVPGIDPLHVASLSGSAADFNTPQFKSIKRYLIKLRAVNPDYRFVYLMANQGADLIFLVDAEDENSADYSAPGEVYTEASEQLQQIFSDGRPLIEDPLEDSFGNWISAIAPIVNLADGKII